MGTTQGCPQGHVLRQKAPLAEQEGEGERSRCHGADEREAWVLRQVKPNNHYKHLTIIIDTYSKLISI